MADKSKELVDKDRELMLAEAYFADGMRFVIERVARILLNRYKKFKECGNCKFWDRDGETCLGSCNHPRISKGDTIGDRVRWTNYNHPQFVNVEDDFLAIAGADDDYGAFFKTHQTFGCILFEEF